MVRRLFKIQEIEFYKDLCGIDEEGKDGVFVARGPFGAQQIYAVQTKRDKLNMSRKASENITEVVTQLRTAAETPIRSPSHAYFICISLPILPIFGAKQHEDGARRRKTNAS